MNMKGLVVLEAFTELDVVFATVGTSYTFSLRDLGSVVDLTYVTAALGRRVA